MRFFSIFWRQSSRPKRGNSPSFPFLLDAEELAAIQLLRLCRGAIAGPETASLTRSNLSHLPSFPQAGIYCARSWKGAAKELDSSLPGNDQLSPLFKQYHLLGPNLVENPRLMVYAFGGGVLVDMDRKLARRASERRPGTVTLGAAFAAVLIALFAATTGNAQQLPATALASFPLDTHQITYASLSQMRDLPNYSMIRDQVLSRPLAAFNAFLISMGINTDRDVDEVMLGFRGEPTNTSIFFGMAAGRFDPDMIRASFQRNGVHAREYNSSELYPFGSGDSSVDTYFTFIDSSTAAFGRLADLKTLLDVRARLRPSLDSNAQFMNWEAELEGTSPQWGIATGAAAANLAIPLLGSKLPIAPQTLFRTVRAVLFRVDWGGDSFTSHLTAICEKSEDATALARVLAIVKSTPNLSSAGANSSTTSLLQDMDISNDNDRVLLTISGPIQSLAFLNR
jgi:hypothetical protein